MGKHDDIINLERPYDPIHQPMSLHNRAAQFAPFDALTGFCGRIWESSRLTENRIDLGEEQKLELNQKLNLLLERIKERPEATFSYFVPDKAKAGGTYRTVTGRVRKVDEYEEMVLLEDNTCIDFEDILTRGSELFAEDEYYE